MNNMTAFAHFSWLLWYTIPPHLTIYAYINCVCIFSEYNQILLDQMHVTLRFIEQRTQKKYYIIYEKWNEYK